LLQIHSGNCLQKIGILDLSLIKLLQNEQGCNFLPYSVSDLTETNLDTENAIEFWSERMAIYKLIGPLALDLLSAPASQAFVERIFSLCGLMTAGRRNRMETSLQMRAFLKLNKRLFEWGNCDHVWWLDELTD